MNSDKLSDYIKDGFMDICKKNFSHLYRLFGENDNIEDLEELCIKGILDGIVKHNTNLTFTSDQLKGIRYICELLCNPKKKTFGLYGYAGTGKTTVIVKLVHYLLTESYIRSVVFAAPTNKAVNIMKAKFKTDINDLIRNKGARRSSKDSLSKQLDKLENKGYKVNFLTIHKLLNYKNDYDTDGSRIFVKGSSSLLDCYDLIIIDECSMIQLQVIMDIFDDIKNCGKKQRKSKRSRIPKILFVGDPSQLPPVNEKNSIIFNKKKKEFDMDIMTEILNRNSRVIPSEIPHKIKDIIRYIIKQKSYTLRQVVRCNDNKVVGLCNNIRAWVLGEIEAPEIIKYKGKCVYLYKRKKGQKKTDTKWFKKCVKYVQDNKDNNQVSNIMLAWTNRVCNNYNNTIRKIIFKKTKLNKFEIGDILMLNDYYNFKVDKKTKNKNNQRFYTSEQIKVGDVEVIEKVCKPISIKISNKFRKAKNFNSIYERLKETLRTINKKASRKYYVWKLYVHKLSEVMVKNIVPEIYQMYVIMNRSKELLQTERDLVSSKIRDLRKYYQIFRKEQMPLIDGEIIRPLWRSFNETFVDPFANVNYGCAITSHKSQASSYYNVFVDIDDILNNPNNDEAKRCVYTAITRCSHEVHLLI